MNDLPYAVSDQDIPSDAVDDELLWEDAKHDVQPMTELTTRHIENILKGIARATAEESDFVYWGQAWKKSHLQDELKRRRQAKL